MPGIHTISDNNRMDHYWCNSRWRTYSQWPELDFENYIVIDEDLKIDWEEPLLPSSNSDFEETEEDEEMTEQESLPSLMDTMKALDRVLGYLEANGYNSYETFYKLKSNIFEI